MAATDFVTITFTYSDALDALHGQLALMGKRAVAKDGETLFPELTFSIAERDALVTHVRQGVSNVVSSVLDKVQGYTSVENHHASFKLYNTRMDALHNSTFQSVFESLMLDYVVFYALQVWISMTRPEMASVLRDERDRRLLALRDFVYHKSSDALAENMGYANVTGEVVKDEDDPEEDDHEGDDHE